MEEKFKPQRNPKPSYCTSEYFYFSHVQNKTLIKSLSSAFHRCLSFLSTKTETSQSHNHNPSFFLFNQTHFNHAVCHPVYDSIIEWRSSSTICSNTLTEEQLLILYKTPALFIVIVNRLGHAGKVTHFLPCMCERTVLYSECRNKFIYLSYTFPAAITACS